MPYINRKRYLRYQKGYTFKYRRTTQGRLVVARAKAKHIRRAWKITLEQYRQLLSHPCSYCGLEIEPTGTGLDRLNNNRGYYVDNVVPCCWICNRTRADFFTPKEMRDFIGPIIQWVRTQRKRVQKS